ncbi:MAG: response regulator [Chloroflexi bacterium]|nr:response regulator [Chloroflexota bacterium]
MAESPRVLVVDDNRHIGAEVRAILSDQGYEVLGTSDRQEVIDLLNIHQPELILLDLHWLHLNGPHLLRAYWEWSAPNATMLVFITDVYAEIAARQFRADGSLTKPVALRSALEPLREYQAWEARV